MHVVKWPNILLKFCGVNITRFLKYVWPFYNIMHERVRKKIPGPIMLWSLMSWNNVIYVMLWNTKEIQSIVGTFGIFEILVFYAMN